VSLSASSASLVLLAVFYFAAKIVIVELQRIRQEVMQVGGVFGGCRRAGKVPEKSEASVAQGPLFRLRRSAQSLP
jgi:hypothetical protein